jgi:hypothetical protein
LSSLKTTALLVFPLFLLAGCSAFFGFNAFAALDKPAPPKLSDYQGGSSGLARLASDLSSPAVVAQLKADPATTLAIESYLDTTYGITTVSTTGPLTTPDQQNAAVLFGDLYLKTTSGDQLVNNIVSSVMTITQTGNISSLISSIIPADVAGDETKFTAMVSGLLTANVAYLAFGASIPGYGVPPGMNLGDVAQKAAVAYMMQKIVDSITPSIVGTTAAAIHEMFLLVNNDPTNQISGINVPDPFTPLDVNLKHIFDAAGAPYPK